VIDNELNEQGYTVAPGEMMEFILTENPTTGYVWKYDETIIGDLFTVASTYKQDKSCKNHPIGCGGKRHFKVRGKEEGNGTLFTCNL